MARGRKSKSDPMESLSNTKNDYVDALPSDAPGGPIGREPVLEWPPHGKDATRPRQRMLSEFRSPQVSFFLATAYFPISRTVNVVSTGFGRGFGFLAVGGTGSFCSVPMVKM